MRSMMRDLTFISCLLVAALMFALAWRGPFVQANSAHAQTLAQSLKANR
jgi:hypothetical protein